MNRAWLLGSVLCGCNPYAEFKPDADGSATDEEVSLLLVWDSSSSMASEADGFARGVGDLAEALRDGPRAHIAITTSTVGYQGGSSSEVDPGEAGRIVGTPIDSATVGWQEQFLETLLCETAYWADTQVPSDPSFACDGGAAVPDVVSVEYLDCLCGFGEWEATPGGSGNEEPLEATLMALCRASDDPTTACDDPISPYASTSDLRTTNWPASLDAPLHVLIVSDEGDNSRRLVVGETEAGVYAEPLRELANAVTVSAIVPGIDPETGGVECSSELNPAPPTWALERMVWMAEATGGLHVPVVGETSDGCEQVDFGQALSRWVAGF